MSSSDEGRVELGSSSLVARNFDGRVARNQRLAPAHPPTRERLIGRFAAPDIGATFDPDTGVTRTLMSNVSFLTEAMPGTADAIAREFSVSNHAVLGLATEDLNSMEVTDVVYSQMTGTTHIYYGQRYLGLPVYNAQLHFNILDDGRVLSVNNSFLPGIARLEATPAPTIAATEAVVSAAVNLSVDLEDAPLVVASLGGDGRRTMIDAPELSKAAIGAELAWLPVNGAELALVWRFQIETPDGNHHFDYTVDADTGAVWTRFDWTSSDSYRVFAWPVESAGHTSPPAPGDGRAIVTDPADPIASPLGWHDDGTSRFTIHRGNNVHAYDDRDGNNTPPSMQPTCTTSRDCSFAVNFGGTPSTYTSASITNLFYWNNLIHDIQYQYGFDEISGNFQMTNFEHDGLGSDPVRAEAQDSASVNNANFSAPPDGTPPRMQMFEWNQTVPRRDGDVDNAIIVHEYGHGISIRLVGGPSNSSCLNNAQQGGEGWSDWFALWYTAQAGDVGTDARGIGTYSLGQPRSGSGIRTQRYSTSPAINTHTYQSIRGMAIPHGVGEVWAQALWEVYWALINQYGFDPDPYNALGGSGNQRAMLYVTEGLKNTACSPTFVDARNGIIAAAAASFGGEDVCLLWHTFAAFGLGVNALPGGSNSTNTTNGFNVPANCACSPGPVADAGPDTAVCVGSSVTIGTPGRPGHSYLWSPGGATTPQIAVSPTDTTTYTLTATTACGSTTDVVVVAADRNPGEPYREDFENGAGGWSATGLWHLADNSLCTSPGFSSPTHAFYYGSDATCDYNTGGLNSGDLTSPPITGLTIRSSLSFDFYRRVENFAQSYDRTTVDVIRSSGAATTLFSLDSRNPSGAPWGTSPTISLAPFAGDTIRLRFRFASVDGASNYHTGWFVDNVAVATPNACRAP